MRITYLQIRQQYTRIWNSIRNSITRSIQWITERKLPSVPYGKIWSYSRLPVFILVTIIFFLYLVPVLQEWTMRTRKYSQEELSPEEIKKIANYTAVTKKSVQSLERKLAALTPRAPYLVINTSQNDFSLYNNHKLIRKGRCSTGSYVLMEDGNQQKWMFETPKGKFRIQGKTTSPVWKKPDWAFIESGMPVPPENHPSRYEFGVLGDYALSLGDGYLIHGTIYKRFLGLPVTHGCIRLNDEDLEAVYRTMPAGSRVYIY
jgi:hypothetical protein